MHGITYTRYSRSRIESLITRNNTDLGPDSPKTVGYECNLAVAVVLTALYMREVSSETNRVCYDEDSESIYMGFELSYERDRIEKLIHRVQSLPSAHSLDTDCRGRILFSPST